MKIKIIYAIFMLVAVALETSFFPNLFPYGIAPDFVLVIIILLAASKGFKGMWKAAVLGGFFLDLASFLPVGINIFSFLAVSFLTGMMAKRFLDGGSSWRYLILALFVLLGTAFNDIFLMIIMKLFAIANGAKFSGFPVLDYGSFLKFGYNLVIFGLINWPVKKLSGHVPSDSGYPVIAGAK